MSIIRPARLRPGDLIGVVSPSSPVAAAVPRRLGRGVAELRRLGFRVRLGPHVTARRGHSAGTFDERAADLHAMFADREVKGIIATIGGYSSHQLLDALDYGLIQANPKVLLGYSDITALHLAIHARTGLVTFLGPALLPHFGEAGGLLPYVRQGLTRMICTPAPAGVWEPAGVTVTETLRWDREDDRPRQMAPAPGPRPLRRGTARGPVIAANLGTLLLLAGTPYWPNLCGVILCVEDDEEETPATVDRYFTQLRHLGVYDGLAGLVVGRFPPSVGFSAADPLEDIILTATRGYRFPVALDFDFGHQDPIFTLPNGVLAELRVGDEAGVRFLEAAVV